MPFKSKAQERWMWAKDPAMAKRWEKDTPKSTRTKLPEKVRSRYSKGPKES